MTYSSTNNIKELNQLIYAEAKLVCDKISVSPKITNRNSKRGWEIRLETQIRNLRQRAKMLKKDKRGNNNTKVKTSKATRGDKSEGTGEKSKTKKMPR